MALFDRRETPGPYTDAIEYKPFLQSDFRRMCAYCERTEVFLGGAEQFEIDHFKPQSSFPELRTYYPNLYYVCRKCNQYKSSKWPTVQQVSRGEVFADPCVEDPYIAHLLEMWYGELTELTPCGEYTNGHIRLDRPDVCEWRRLRQKARGDLPTLRNLEENLLLALELGRTDRDEIERQIEVLRRYMHDLQNRFQIS